MNRKAVAAIVPAGIGAYPNTGDTMDVRITVSQMSDQRYETLVAVHELIEAVLCRQAGVKEADVDKFDMAYEKARKPGDDSEPGG